MNKRDLARLRLVAQHIAGPGFASAAEAVAWMTATQAQEFPSSLAAIALRTEGGSRARVEAALDAGAVVRTWPMRGTLHLVAAADVRWMLTLGPPRVATTMARRRRELELTDADLRQARSVAERDLPGRRDVTRNGLMELWEAEGLSTAGQRGYHLIVDLAHTGVIVLGPMHDGQQAIVLADDWLPSSRAGPDPDEAVGELFLRFMRSHGPATLKDFSWWTGLTLASAKIGWALAVDQLETIAVDGIEYLMDPTTPDRLAAARTEAKGVFLLPGFDELVLGYTDRSATLPTEHGGQLAPGANGIFRAAIVADGQIVGTWRRPPRPGGPPIAEPFTPLSPATAKAVVGRYRDYPA